MQIRGPISQPPRGKEPEESREPEAPSRRSRGRDDFKIPERDARKKPREFEELIKETKKFFYETAKDKGLEKMIHDLEKKIEAALKNNKIGQELADELKEELKEIKDEASTYGNKELDKKIQELEKKVEELDDKKLGVAFANFDQAIKDLSQNFVGDINDQKAIAASSEVKQVINAIADLVKQKVDTLAVNENSVLMNLKSTDVAKIPTFLSGAQVSVNKIDDRTIAISISNLSVQSATRAVTFINERTTELQTLIQNLQAKNIVLAELRVGDQLIHLPAVQATPQPTITSPQGAGAEGFREREQGQGQGGGGREGGEEKEERKRR